MESIESLECGPSTYFYSNMTGTGQARGPSGGEAVGQNDKGQQQAYLHLALSIISAFCRLPELAAMDENISKVSILVETLASKYNLPPSFKSRYLALHLRRISSEKITYCLQL